MKNKEEQREFRQATTLSKYKLPIRWPHVFGVWREVIFQLPLWEFKEALGKACLFYALMVRTQLTA